MASKNYRFVSPGVQLRELDRSQIPDTPDAIGPVIIGRAQRGPALQPVKVQNFTEFAQIFGNPLAGGDNGDIWRNGNEGLSPQYGAFAAQAWLSNNSPLTYVRLLGRAHQDAEAGGEAGWKIGGDGTGDGGGAFGLFLVDSGSGVQEGTLAAVFYCTSEHYMALSGTEADSPDAKNVGTAIMLKNEGASSNGGQWVTVLRDKDDNDIKKFEFNFDASSDKYIRNVFNTDATKLNTNLYSAAEGEKYILGESYESVVQSKISNGANTGEVFGVVLGLHGTETNVDYNSNQVNSNPAATPWIVAQAGPGPTGSFDPRELKKLFQVVALDHGIWTNSHLKISIENIRYSDDPTEQYGSFTLNVRSASDKDSAPVVLESFSNLNLKPGSPDYICARIGTQYARWSDVDRRWRYYGDYVNNSKHIFIRPASDLGSNEDHIPFGFQGPLRPVGIKTFSGSTGFRGSYLTASSPAANSSSIPYGGSGLGGSKATGSQLIANHPTNLTASFTFPATALRADTTQGNLSDPTDAYFGVRTVTSAERFDNTYVDLVRGIPDSIGHPDDPFGPRVAESGSGNTRALEFSYIFTMEDVSHLPTTGTSLANYNEFEAYYVSGSRVAGTSISTSGAVGSTYGSGSYKDTLDAGYNQFTVPMFGGIEGIDITEMEPFNNNVMGGGATQMTSYAYNSVRIGIDTCADPENVDMNILSVPGVIVPGLTNRVLDVCESRGDALGIIDIQGGYTPKADRTDPTANDYDANIRGDASSAARTFRQRQINNSYGAAYYPWTQVRDPESGVVFYCPPSVAAVGTLSYSEAVSELWFAPAGFNRGGLTAGAAGVPVINVTEKLSSKERDTLYDANINPIASFPSEGLVVFGQKTTQVTRSALDRINVRRLMIFVKKEISRIANGLLFDQNTAVTWNRFKGQVIPFLDSVKARLGLEDFKVVLDETTTTPDLIDQNIMYAKVFLKPTRAIEFIAVDFIITNTGASFED